MVKLNISGSFDLGSLDDLTRQEVEQHLLKYGDFNPDSINVRYTKEKDRFSCCIKVEVRRKEFIATEIDTDVKVAMGKAIANMQRQLRKNHDKNASRKEKKGSFFSNLQFWNKKHGKE